MQPSGGGRGPVGAARGRREPRPVGDLVAAVLDDLAVDASSVLRTILRSWPDTVGAATAQHCQPAALRDGVLEVETDSSLWSQELNLRSGTILAELRRAHGREAPRQLWFRVR